MISLELQQCKTGKMVNELLHFTWENFKQLL